MNDLYRDIIARNAKIRISADDMKEEFILSDDLGYDSISFVGMIVEIEGAYNFTFDDEYINPEKLKTVKDVAAYIRSKIKE